MLTFVGRAKDAVFRSWLVVAVDPEVDPFFEPDPDLLRMPLEEELAPETGVALLSTSLVFVALWLSRAIGLGKFCPEMARMSFT